MLMAWWVLKCKNCEQTFTHSRISEAIEDYFIPAKPKLPAKGSEQVCPHCKTKAIYHADDLTYQSD